MASLFSLLQPSTLSLDVSFGLVLPFQTSLPLCTDGSMARVVTIYIHT